MNTPGVCLYFENCDSIVIPSKYIGQMRLDDVQESIAKSYYNSITFESEAESFAIEILKDASLLKSDFGKTLDEIVYDIMLSRMFISGVSFNEKDICIDGVEKFQIVSVSDLGNIYIVVSDTKNWSDYFDEDTINNPSYQTFLKFVQSDTNNDDTNDKK